MHTLLPWLGISGSGAAAGDSPFIRCDKENPPRTCGTRLQFRTRHSAQGSGETLVSPGSFVHFSSCREKCTVPWTLLGLRPKVSRARGHGMLLWEIFHIPNGRMWAPWSAAEQVPLGYIRPYEPRKGCRHLSNGRGRRPARADIFKRCTCVCRRRDAGATPITPRRRDARRSSRRSSPAGGWYSNTLQRENPYSWWCWSTADSPPLPPPRSGRCRR